MPEIQTNLFGVTVEGLYSQPVLYAQAKYEALAEACLNSYSSYGLRAPNISLRRNDAGYNYELSFSLFAGNATFRFRADKIELVFQNGSSSADVQLVMDCIARAYELPVPHIGRSVVVGTAHSLMASPEERTAYMSTLAPKGRGIPSAGIIIYVRVASWVDEVRFLVDRSVALPNGLFLSMDTTHAGKISKDHLVALGKAFEESAKLLDLTFKSQ